MLDLLQEELKIAMKAKDKATLIGLRNIMGKLKVKQIDKGKKLTKEESISILSSLVKQLRYSIEQYKSGGREDLAEKEAFELTLIEKYLPKQLSKNDVRTLVQKTIESIQPESTQDMGRIMGAVMIELTGTEDGKIVQKIVLEELSSLS